MPPKSFNKSFEILLYKTIRLHSSPLLLCSSYAVTSSVIYYSTHTRKNVNLFAGSRLGNMRNKFSGYGEGARWARGGGEVGARWGRGRLCAYVQDFKEAPSSLAFPLSRKLFFLQIRTCSRDSRAPLEVKIQFKVNKVKIQFKVNKVKIQFKVNKVKIQFKVNKVKIQFPDV